MDPRKAQLIALLALLSACTPPSDLSKEMEAKLIPKIVAWSKDGGVLEFQTVQPGAYTDVCIVQEYNCVGGKNSVVKVELFDVHSNSGRCVPESRSAIVLVDGGQAHSALIESSKVRFDVPASGKCVGAAGAILRSAGRDGRREATASLEQR